VQGSMDAPSTCELSISQSRTGESAESCDGERKDSASLESDRHFRAEAVSLN